MKRTARNNFVDNFFSVRHADTQIRGKKNAKVSKRKTEGFSAKNNVKELGRLQCTVRTPPQTHNFF